MQLMKVKQISTLIGSALLHFMIGSGNTFANLNTYITSYLRQNGSKDANYGQSVWYTAVGVTTFTFFTIFSGFIVNKIGTKITCLIATLILCGSVGLTSIAIKHSFVGVLITWALIQNIGSGLMYSTIIVNAIKWFPGRGGQVAGLITGANAFSSFVFTQMQTFYLNPNNVKPDSDGYFDEPNMLSHVPKLFILLSLIYGSIGLLGFCLVFNFKEPEQTNATNSSIQTVSNGSQRNLMDSMETDSTDVSSSLFDTNYSLRQALNSRFFLMLWITFAFSTQTVYFVNSMVKAFGQSFINDDHFLALILSFSFIVNGMGGVFWGKVLDHLKFRDTIIGINAFLAISTFSLIITSYENQKLLFAIWVFCLSFTTVGVFASYLPEVVRKFGNKNAIAIYGFIHTGPASVSIILSPVLELTLNSIGWFPTFCLIGSLNAFSMIIIMASYSYHS